jgi:hypothetical protein
MDHHFESIYVRFDQLLARMEAAHAKLEAISQQLKPPLGRISYPAAGNIPSTDTPRTADGAGMDAQL